MVATGRREYALVNYKVVGQGPPLLLIHGFGVTFSVWDQLAPALSTYFQLIMVELPGLGQSPAPDPNRPYYETCPDALEELRAHLGFEQWAVLSYSSGARAGEAYARRFPQRVSRAVFLCPAEVSGLRPLGLDLAVRVDQLWPRLGDWALSSWRMHLLVIALAFNGRRHWLAAEWAREIKAQSLPTLKSTLRDLPRGRRSNFSLPDLPSLVVWGQRDLLTPRPRRPRTFDLIIPADHSAPVRAAPVVAAAILPFLRGAAQPG